MARAEARLDGADLKGYDLSNSDLRLARLFEAELVGADLHEAWELRGAPKGQAGLIIHASDNVAPISADNLETAHFLFQLLDNPKIASVIGTVNSRTVLILGRFTPQRKRVLELLRGLLAVLPALAPSIEAHPERVEEVAGGLFSWRRVIILA